MVSGTDRDYKALVVRIAVGNREKLKGTGILYIRNLNERVCVFTAAHVISDCFDINGEVYLFLDFYDQKYDNHLIEGAFDKVDQKNANERWVYIPDSYNSYNLNNDIAVISFPWENWMKELPTYEFRDAVLNETVYGWGYPQAMNSKSTEIEGTCISITGKVGNVISDRYVLNYEALTRERGVSRHDEMSGYSGTGLFQRENEKVYFTGCLSGAAGEESAGSRVWIISSNVFFRAIEKLDMQPAIPNSFMPYKQDILEQVEEFSEDVRNFLQDSVDTLIEDKKLLPSQCIHEKSIESADLLCKTDRKSCKHYWKGQLTRAICFCEILGLNPEELSDIKISDKQDGYTIRIEFLCTEEKVSRCIQLLLEKALLKKTLKNESGIILLWNGQSSVYYTKTIRRSEIRRIIVSIANTPRQKKKLSEKNDFFNIVDGDIEESNIAMIGMGELFDTVIYDGNGNIEKMRGKFNELIKDAWEVLDEHLE